MKNVVGTPEWMYERYQKPETDISDHKECKEIFCCAYREYDALKGSTGGPAGVLHTQECLLGKRLGNIKLNYIFKPADYRVPENVWAEMQELDFKIKMVIAGAGYILSNNRIAESIRKHNAPVLVCHDMGTAYGAYLLDVDYILVYHQQGALLNEILSLGLEYTKVDEEVITKIEEIVISNAYKVYFPSKGAKGVYLETTTANLDEVMLAKLSDEPLYNTISEENCIEAVGEVLKRYDIEISGLEEVFISVGDYNRDKGIDRIPAFLQAYQMETNNSIVWIAIGNNTAADMVSEINKDASSREIKSYLIPHRIKHEEVLALLSLADYYIMFHRNSIFDLATLEAMRSGKKIILSDCEANREFNVLNNVVLVTDDCEDAVKQTIRRKEVEWSRLNRTAFKKSFDNRSFVKRYAEVMKELSLLHCTQEKYESKINKTNLSIWRDRYKGKKCVICGSGQSLDIIRKREMDCIYIALNKALFYDKLHFDILFMQDMPKNQSYTLEDYNSYDCVKFYGIITNVDIDVEGLGKESAVYHNVVNQIIRYELENTVFDYRMDEFEYDIANGYVKDAQSVLFSALQFALYAGFTDIQLCGVDFSDVNYGNTYNFSKYAVNVCKNLIELKRQWNKKYKNVRLSFYNTANRFLLEKFSEIDNSDKEIIVSGIYTEDYAGLVRLQEQSCRDGYYFDFRHITDEEWRTNRTDNGFAFFGGNTIKVHAVIEKIKEHFGKILIITDADVIFLRETRGRIFAELADYDMLFLRERAEKERLFDKAVANVNIGFVVIKCNEQSLAFWQQVLQRTEDERGWDQEIANKILSEKNTNIKWNLLSEEFLNGGSINTENFINQRICTSCGTIAKRYGFTKEEFLWEAYRKYHNEEWFDVK